MTLPRRPVIIAANWKMNTTPGESGPLAAEMAAATADSEPVLRVICPPFTSLAEVRAALVGTGVQVGAQNIHAEPAGAYTGEVSAAMVTRLATWTIVGHSERRRDQGETDELIWRKVDQALRERLTPILCVGEQLEERESGRAEEVVRRQLRGALDGIQAVDMTALQEARAGEERPGLVVAYEPVWAIGTGLAATGADASAMAAAIRTTCREMGWAEHADGLPVLYGGSVTSGSIGEFLDEPEIDGALVGGASLKVDEMAGIVARAATTARARAAAGAAR
jgi:triosephosphate isomerase